jgi:7-cyano-7-deazaguanine synthase
MSAAVVLLSGGLDSATVLALAARDGFACHCLTVDYGQRHRAELEAARRVADAIGCVSHRTVRIDLAAIGGSALTDAMVGVPKDREISSSEIPVTYVPARNTVLLAVLLALAEVVGANELFIGVNAVDYSGYPDCRPEFLRAFETVANLATRAGVEGSARFRVRAPLASLSKAEIVELGSRLGVDYSLTVSCYDPDDDGRACGRCDACRLRIKGFESAGLLDPTRYVSER